MGDSSVFASLPSARLSEGLLIIKAQYEDDVRRIPITNDEITLDELILMMQRVFRGRLSPSDDLLIKYRDTDGDWITISDNQDLTHAKSYSRLLQIRIQVKNAEQIKIATALRAAGNQAVVQAIEREIDNFREKVHLLLGQLDQPRYSGAPSGGVADGAANANSAASGSSAATAVTASAAQESVAVAPKAVDSKASREFDPLKDHQPNPASVMRLNSNDFEALTASGRSKVAVPGPNGPQQPQQQQPPQQQQQPPQQQQQHPQQPQQFTAGAPTWSGPPSQQQLYSGQPQAPPQQALQAQPPQQVPYGSPYGQPQAFAQPARPVPGNPGSAGPTTAASPVATQHHPASAPYAGGVVSPPQQQQQPQYSPYATPQSFQQQQQQQRVPQPQGSQPPQPAYPPQQQQPPPQQQQQQQQQPQYPGYAPQPGNQQYGGYTY
ncbi:hypothetical protein CAOG_04788 [Capsaspora owczarzaki ATCC 30864]|uniref:PB1 domain-containing protein n=1 Tax=Capsaspora owczarzaki (strain ATCC 30864) TaxID=595528 RepID=A0A0D2X3D1_CAPO3|nr:hypothetical protein CAOG_04788 [Capsaspora owczarzaki ATCC 30864]KJE94099.1 hypothetical protein CAOG_004788 [Capsaspora owczarzaki ATCC 30864]|eukprot:XP_004347539.1 hypothetical protein CAOG_04788 [Capsaspora owczarzaki ATCC 30864]